MEAAIERLKQDDPELAAMVANTVQQADQVLAASVYGGADTGSILAAHTEVTKAAEKLRAEGKVEEAANMEQVAVKLQDSLQSQQPRFATNAPPQRAATPRMEAAIEKLKQENPELAAVVANTVQQADQVLAASAYGAADTKSLLAASTEVTKAAEKLRAEGKIEEAAKMEQVAAKLQDSLQAQAQPKVASNSPPQRAVTPRMVAAIEKLKEGGHEELAAMVANTVQWADQVLDGSAVGVTDTKSILAAHSEVVKATEKLRAEGQFEEAAKMEDVAAKLQNCLQDQVPTTPLQRAATPRMAEAMEKLKEDGHGELAETMTKAVQHADQVLAASTYGAADSRSILAAHSEAAMAAEKLRAEGRVEEAAKMEQVAAKLQDCLKAPPAPLPLRSAHRGELPPVRVPAKFGAGKSLPPGRAGASLSGSRSEPNLRATKRGADMGSPQSSPEFFSRPRSRDVGGTERLPSLGKSPGKHSGRTRNRRRSRSSAECALPSIREGNVMKHDKSEGAMLMRTYNVKGGVDMLQLLKDGRLPQFICRPL
jgi:DNA-binding NarL/FixJ family response regulator